MGLEVPCGQCMQCRLQKREEWVTRILHEMMYYDEYMFCTLTYDEDHLPGNSSLEKSDLQKFFKRLRKQMHDKKDYRKIKYFACGEYGEENGRPHYHIIILGLDYLKDDDISMIKDCWTLCDWNLLGERPFGCVNQISIRYVVSYLEKSIKGKWEEYAYDKIESPFHLVSKGMGKNYAMENKKIMEESGCIRSNGYKKAIPRYYSEVAEISRDTIKEYALNREMELIEKLTGKKISLDDLYIFEDVESNVNVIETLKKSRIQNDLNLNARDKINSRRFKRDT